MGSNQELMILNLLNLYLSYVDLKNQDVEESESMLLSKHYASKDPKILQNPTEKSKQRVQSIPVIHSLSNTPPDTGAQIVPDIKNKEKYIDNLRSDTSIALITYSQNNSDLATIIKPSQNKIVKRRRRGVNKSKKELEKVQCKPRKRRWRVCPINQDRVITGYHRRVFAKIKKMDQQQFFEHTRMSKSLFDWLLTFAHSSLRKSRQSILAEERLAITLNYLAYGTSLQSIARQYKVGRSTARQIVLDTCTVLWSLLSPVYLNEPTHSQYADIAEDFKSSWDIPNCIGAINGKHVSIRVPSKSAHISNKDGLSMLILGVCDTKYKFVAVSVESFNNQSDNEISQLSSLKNAIIADSMTLPSNKPLYPSSSPFPHFFISDINFPLQKNIMCPYNHVHLDVIRTIYNNKISRALTITENTFGILTARFRVLLTKIEFLPNNCKTIILACIALHNFIMTNDEEQLYCPANFIDRLNFSGNIDEGGWRTELKNNGDQPLTTMTSRSSRPTFEFIKLRDTLAKFFGSEGMSHELEIV